MASTWSALKVELLETGANAGQWGNLTNANLGDAVLGEAITGQATVDFSSDADVTITLTDAATTQAARNLRLNITESSSGVGSVRNLILGSGCQIEKFYLINNTGTGAKTIKNTSGTGISVPAGKATLVYNNGTNVVDAASYFTSLTLGSALPVASGGTGITSFGSGVATFLGTPSSANLAAALTDETGSGSAVFATSPTLVTPNLGTPTTLVLSSATGLPLSSGVTGILPVANGGTATATPSLVQGSNITITGTWPNQTIASSNSGGTVTSVGGTGTVNGISLSGSVTTSGSLTLGGTLSGVNLASQVTGTLPVGNGGTGAATLTANNVLLGNGSSAVQFIAPSSSGNVLTSNGSTWASAAPAGGGFSAMSVFTGSGTFTIPTGKTTLKVYVVGGGGGGGDSNVDTGGTGGNSTLASGTQSISTITGNGGLGGQGNNNGGNSGGDVGGDGGAASGGDLNIRGGGGGGGNQNVNDAGGHGGDSYFGGGAAGQYNTAGAAGGNYGGGGSGTGGGGGSGGASAGGGGGGTAIKYLTSVTPGNTLAVTVGAGGAGATPASRDGGNGSAGVVVIEY